QLRVVGNAEEPRTNHFLHPDFVAADELNVFARNSSVLRRDSFAAALAELPAGAGVDDHFAVLGRRPVRVDDTGDIRREKTVATVVVRPGRGELHVRRGAAASDTHTFRLSREHA